LTTKILKSSKYILFILFKIKKDIRAFQDKMIKTIGTRHIFQHNFVLGKGDKSFKNHLKENIMYKKKEKVRK